MRVFKREPRSGKRTLIVLRFFCCCGKTKQKRLWKLKAPFPRKVYGAETVEATRDLGAVAALGGEEELETGAAAWGSRLAREKAAPDFWSAVLVAVRTGVLVAVSEKGAACAEDAQQLAGRGPAERPVIIIKGLLLRRRTPSFAARGVLLAGGLAKTLHDEPRAGGERLPQGGKEGCVFEPGREDEGQIGGSRRSKHEGASDSVRVHEQRPAVREPASRRARCLYISFQMATPGNVSRDIPRSIWVRYRIRSDALTDVSKARLSHNTLRRQHSLCAQKTSLNHSQTPHVDWQKSILWVDAGARATWPRSSRRRLPP